MITKFFIVFLQHFVEKKSGGVYYNNNRLSQKTYSTLDRDGKFTGAVGEIDRPRVNLGSHERSVTYITLYNAITNTGVGLGNAVKVDRARPIRRKVRHL